MIRSPRFILDVYLSGVQNYPESKIILSPRFILDVVRANSKKILILCVKEKLTESKTQRLD
jgi:hypothetical protein